MACRALPLGYAGSMRAVRLAPALCLLALACAPVSAPERLVDPDPDRTGLDGEDGPYGAEVREVRVQARLVEALDVEVVVPVLGEAGPAAEPGPWPAAVLLPGALVEPERMRWLGAHFATRGVVTLVPDSPSNFALFRSDNGLLALEAVEEMAAEPGHPLQGVVRPGGRAVVLGHSLGGATAALLWADGRFDGLGLLAAYPPGSVDPRAQPGTAVLSVSGGDDAVALPGEVRAGLEGFPDPAWLALVGGMTHYSWTDDVSPAEASREPAPGRGNPATRRDAQRALDLWTDLALRGDADAADALDGGAVGEDITWE